MFGKLYHRRQTFQQYSQLITGAHLGKGQGGVSKCSFRFQVLLKGCHAENVSMAKTDCLHPK